MNKIFKILSISFLLLTAAIFVISDSNIRQNLHVFGFLNATNGTDMNLIGETEVSGNFSFLGNNNVTFSGRGSMADNDSCLLLLSGDGSEIALCRS